MLFPKVKTIGDRVMLALAALLVLMLLILLLLFANRSTDVLIDQEVRSARDIALITEAVRTIAARKWELGVFTPASLRKLLESGGPSAREAVLTAVPVVEAWQNAESAAQAGGFEFKTPRQGARNPKNEPDSVEAKALETLIADRALREYWLVDEQRNAVRYFRPVVLTQECLYCHGDPAQAKTLWGRDDGKDLTGNLLENKKVGDIHGAFEVIRPLAQADTALHQSLAVATAIVLTFLVVMVSIMRWITRRMITRPIDGAISSIQQAQEAHDLTLRLDDSGDDEVSRLGRTFNQFLASLQLLIKRVHASVGNVADAAASVKYCSDQTSASMLEQQAKTEQVAAAMHEMTATVEDIARHATSCADMAQRASDETLQGNTVVADTINSINHVASEVERAADVIRQVETDSSQIGAIVDVVKGISEQTNLLALNAAIEAARAGEQGRGFAVVADEVRILANRTQDATRRIRDMIDRLQEGTRGAVKVMEDGRLLARQGVEVAAKAGESLEAIARAVTEISDMNASIASAAVEQAAVSEEINRSVTTISEEGGKAGNNARITAESSEQMTNLAATLLQDASAFKV